MSQRDVYEIIKELGGEAYSSEIRKRAKEKFPDRTLYLYVGDRLKKLKNKKIVESEKRGNDILWKIVSDFG